MAIFAKQPNFNKHLLILRGGGGKWNFNDLAGCKGQAVLSREKSCNLCVHFVAFTLALSLSHLVRYHASDPNFHVLCGINGWSKTYRNCIRSFIFVCGPLHHHVSKTTSKEKKMVKLQNRRMVRTIWIVIRAQTKWMKTAVKHTIVHLCPRVKTTV